MSKLKPHEGIRSVMEDFDDLWVQTDRGAAIMARCRSLKLEKEQIDDERAPLPASDSPRDQYLHAINALNERITIVMIKRDAAQE
jgi:hypothetical protein